MMLVMVKEADLNRIEVPEDYEVLDATPLGNTRLGQPVVSMRIGSREQPELRFCAWPINDALERLAFTRPSNEK